VYYDQDWKPLDKDQFAGLQREMVAAPRWIIDGNYASGLPIRLQAADTVIFLDLPARTCQRGVADLGHARPGRPAPRHRGHHHHLDRDQRANRPQVQPR
jgi:hypothetical protein